jgi:hypothetical protein
MIDFKRPVAKATSMSCPEFSSLEAAAPSHSRSESMPECVLAQTLKPRLFYSRDRPDSGHPSNENQSLGTLASRAVSQNHLCNRS